MSCLHELACAVLAICSSCSCLSATFAGAPEKMKYSMSVSASLCQLRVLLCLAINCEHRMHWCESVARLWQGCSEAETMKSCKAVGDEIFSRSSSPVSTHCAAAVLGNAMTSLMDGTPASSIASLSRPNAMPPCGGRHTQSSPAGSRTWPAGASHVLGSVKVKACARGWTRVPMLEAPM